MDHAVEDHQINILGLNVYYRTAGNPNSPPLVLLNGWGARINKLPFLGNHVNSESAIKEFTRSGYRVYSPEHPGLMRSETPRSVWGPKEYLEYVKEFVEKVGLKEFILVGQSFGGAVATLYAATYPEDLKTLVLVNAGLSHDKKFNLVFKRRKYFGWILRANFIPKLVKKALVSACLGVPWRDVERENYESRSIMWEIFSNWSLPNVYAKIRVPTTLIWGKYDMLFPLSSAREVTGEIPDAKLFTVLGGHSVLYTQPKKIAGLILSNLP